MTAAERIEVQFGKWTRKFPLPHCVVLSKEEVAEIVRLHLDKPIVRIATKGGSQILLTRSSLTVDAAVFPFETIVRYHWIDPDTEVKVRDKKEHFDRLVIVSRSGQFTLDGLGQAVFPLMKSLDWIFRERKK